MLQARWGGSAAIFFWVFPFPWGHVAAASSPAPDNITRGQLSSGGVAEGAPSSLDLIECYQLAKKQSETLMIQVEQIDQLEQQFRQILGGILPNISFNASEKYQQKNPTSATFAPSPAPQVNFTLTQPLFSGFREYAAMRSFKHQENQSRLLLKFADQQLFQNVSNAFYLTLGLEKNLEDVQSLRGFTADRVKELRDREEKGKSRKSEVLSVESQLATITSQAEGLKGQISTARELLSFLIGQDASAVILLDKLPDRPQLDSQDAVLQRANTRSDVRAAREAVESQRAQVKIAQGNWYPQAGFVGDYYLKRIPFYQPIRWDATFNLSLPIFSGGSQLAQVRQTESQLRAAQDSESLIARQARSQIRSAYLALRTTLSQSQTLGEAYQKARESYRLQVREYRLGIADNLTVIQALNDMQNAKLSMDQTSIQTKINYIQLKVATEELP